MAKELVMELDDEELTMEVPAEELVMELPKKRVSNPGKQAIAGVLDLATEIPGLLGLAGSGLQGGTNYLIDKISGEEDQSFKEHFVDAMETGLDAGFLNVSQAGRDWTNKTLGITEPTSTEDILARNAALFIPIPGMGLAKGAGMAARAARLAMDVTLPTVKKGTKKSMALRGLGQGLFGLGIEQGIRGVIDDPVNLPLLFSDVALSGGTDLTQVDEDGKPITGRLPDDWIQKVKRGEITTELASMLPTGILDDLTMEIGDEELTMELSKQAQGEAIHDRLDTDLRMQKAEDWGAVKTAAIIAGGLLGGTYVAKRALQNRGLTEMTRPPKPDPNFDGTKYLYEQTMDRGKVTDHVFEEMGVDDAGREAVDADRVTDFNGVGREAVRNGKYGQGFDNNKWISHSEAALDTDKAVLMNTKIDTLGFSTKYELFDEAMRAQSELSAIRRGKRGASLWRKGISDDRLDAVVAAAKKDTDVKALMKKHSQNYRADLEYEVHRAATTRKEADDLIDVFGDTYMPFYGKTEGDFLRRMIRKFGGWRSKKGDELSTVAEWQARTGGGAEQLLDSTDALKRHRLHNAAFVNEQLYRNNMLIKMAGIRIDAKSAKGYVRQALRGGKFVDAKGAMSHSETGRGTHLLAVGDLTKRADDIDAMDIDVNNPRMKSVLDDADIEKGLDKELSLADLERKWPGEVETVIHQGKVYAYRVPDAGIRAGLNLHPKLGRELAFMNHWKNVFTKFTTGDWSLFAPISHMFSAQTVASATAGMEGTRQAWKSYGRSFSGAKEMLVDQMNGLIADHLTKAIATNSGWGKNSSLGLRDTLHNRYSNSLLARIRSETGRTTTGIGSAETTLQGMLDEFGPTFAKFYGASNMGLLKNVWRAINNAANEGPAYGVIKRELGQMVQAGEAPTIQQVRKAVDKGKDYAGDMSRRGASNLAVGFNATVPFSSAMLQSWNALGSAAKHDWKAFSIGVGSLIGAPTLMELTINAGIGKVAEERGWTFPDASGKEWTYDDYYWNGFTTQQRADNFILFVPGRPPWEAIVIPVAPEWGLFRSVVMESADALFNLSRTGAIDIADDGRDQVGRNQFLGALHRVFDIPTPPLAAMSLSLLGLDIRAGFNIEIGEDPEAPETKFSFLKKVPIGTGERITSRMGRTADVNGHIDKNIAAAIKDIFGAAGSAYVALHEAIASGWTNEGGSLVQGLEQGLESILDSGRRQARYTNMFGKVLKPNPNDEIASSLHGKRQALFSLSKDMKVLMGMEGFILENGKQVPIDTIIPTQDPIRQDLAMNANVIKNNIAMVDKTIARLRGEISKMKLATTLGTTRERQDRIDAKNLEIQTYKAQQLSVLHNWEDRMSEMLTERYGRDLTVSLSGGLRKTIGARPNLD